MKLNCLLLCNKPNLGNDASTIIDHIDSLMQNETHTMYLLSNMGDLPLKLDLNKFDVVIIHYSLALMHNHYISITAKKQIRAFKGLKVVFIQDEYREINKIIQEFQFLNINVLFTCFPEQEIEKIYSKKDLPNVSKYTTLTGFVPPKLAQEKPSKKIRDRTIDVGYRGRILPYYLGELAHEKFEIAEKWLKNSSTKSLINNISCKEKDRIYGKNWLDFVSNCKVMLGVESGASVMDFTGELEKNIADYMFINPDASFHQVQNLFLKNHEWKYKLNQISPRCFEAITLKTVLVLYEGEYSNILIPDKHYISLKKDFSNIDDVVAKIQDTDYLQNIASQAYADIALNPEYSYSSFANQVAKVITQEFERQIKIKVINSYTAEEFKKNIKIISIKKRGFNILYTNFKRLPYSVRETIKLLLTPRRILHVLKMRTKKIFHKKASYE